LIALICVLARLRCFYPVTRITLRQWGSQVVRAFGDALLALMMPVLILGGIYSGFFTTTEAAVVAVLYALLVSKFVYKQLRLRDLPEIFGRSAVTSSIILMIVGFAAIFAYVLTVNQVPHRLGEFLTGVSSSPIVFLLLVNMALFLVGMFMESLAAIIILAPILAPAAAQFGIDPVHFGPIMVINLAVGMVTPPVRLHLLVVSQVANIRLDQIIPPLVPFLLVLVHHVLIISYIPFLTTWFM